MESVLVIGAGFMGSGIAQVCAQAGCQVYLMDVKQEALDKAMSQIQWSLGKLGSKGLLKDSPDTVFKRISAEHNMGAAARVNRVLEAALEIEPLKRDIFQELDRITPPHIPISSNTSTIPISRIAQATKHPERVLGLHFFGPVPLMGLVEVIKGEKTSPEVLEQGVAFIKSLGKTPVRVLKDVPGFVMNRIFAAAFKEALSLAEAGVATPEDIDTGMRLGYGWNAGPFEIADNAGVDIELFVGQSFKALGDDYLAPDLDLIERMIKADRLGRKSSRGFYRYTPDGKRLPWGNEDRLPAK